MHCSKCETDNAAASRFCSQCGTPLTKRCPKCTFENGPEGRFCSQCGSSLDSAANTHEEVQPHDGPTGERRHLTVLFCDLAGSSQIAAQLDPEEWRETVAGYHRAATEAITRFGGHVAKYLGDGVMAFFGYPEAHDDDAERAARAGLAILDVMAKLDGLPTAPKAVGKDRHRFGCRGGGYWRGQGCRRIRRHAQYCRSGTGGRGSRHGGGNRGTPIG